MTTATETATPAQGTSSFENNCGKSHPEPGVHRTQCRHVHDGYDSDTYMNEHSLYPASYTVYCITYCKLYTVYCIQTPWRRVCARHVVTAGTARMYA